MVDTPESGPIHEYDGIQECDNQIPRWFTWLFLISVAWSGVYVFWYHGLGMPIGRARIDIELAAKAKAAAAEGSLSEVDLRVLSKDPLHIAKGKTAYTASNCGMCHGTNGQGQIAPNLRDAWWLFGNGMADMVEVIYNGKGQMMAQKNLGMSRETAVDLACYLAELNRQGPVAGKPHDPAREKETPINY